MVLLRKFIFRSHLNDNRTKNNTAITIVFEYVIIALLAISRAFINLWTYTIKTQASISNFNLIDMDFESFLVPKTNQSRNFY